jgi:hypothetical protein
MANNVSQEADMSKELFSSIDIDAPAETVWQILIDFAAFPTWNPFIVGAEGKAQVGERVTLRMQPVVGSAITLHPTVVELVEGRRLRWQGRLGLRGLFDADHLFIVEPSPVAESRFIQRERFTGALVPFVRRSLDRGTLPAFQAMNAAIKDRAEKAIAAGV